MLTASELEELLLLNDIVLPVDEVTVTSSGDWPTIAGRDNFREASLRRVVTQQGTMVHRPLYGGNLLSGLERPATDEELTDREVEIDENLRRDPRMGEIEVSVAVDANVPNRVQVRVDVQPLRIDETETVGLELEI